LDSQLTTLSLLAVAEEILGTMSAVVVVREVCALLLLQLVVEVL
jgi:hypothetical protein